MIKTPAKLHLPLPESRSSATERVRSKRPRARRIARDASRPLQRRKQRLNRPRGNTKAMRKRSNTTALYSTDGCKRRTRAGKSKKRNWKPLFVGRMTRALILHFAPRKGITLDAHCAANVIASGVYWASTRFRGPRPRGASLRLSAPSSALATCGLPRRATKPSPSSRKRAACMTYALSPLISRRLFQT
jgi:hypothetical protein